MADTIITLAEARDQGLSHYFTGKPCKRGHLARRAVKRRQCLECENIIAKRWQAENQTAVRKARKARYWRDPEGERAKVQSYRDDNRDHVRALGRAHYQKPHVKEYQRRYREDNKDRREKQIANWQKANREKRSADNRRWYYRDVKHARAVHLEKVHRRRAIKLQAEGSHTKEELAALLERQGHRCSYCRTDLRKAGKHADHIVALSRGGSDAIENIQYLCAPCNLSKGAKDPQDFAQERGLLL